MKVKISKILLLCMLAINLNVTKLQAKADMSLYSLSAVLLDADTSRVLYGKQENEIRANASTTKIMTLILALEYGEIDSLVTVSSYAAKMPDVQMNIEAGEQYYFKDLLYSMMLESHNDSAVCIAEAISGDVSSFAQLMNEKAKEIGMNNTYFITPNGLDDSDDISFHHTTAYDLALLMKYCIMDSEKKDEFIAICQTKEYTLKDYTGNKLFVLKNKNKLLDMLDGVIAGKTGFTANAGYCYVSAISYGENTYIIALLGCGWPNNKNYKWEDTKKLYKYACEHYERKCLLDNKYPLVDIKVIDGIEADKIHLYSDMDFSAVVSADDIIDIKVDLPSEILAPVARGDIIGSIAVYINDKVIYVSNIYSEDTVYKKDYNYYIKKLISKLMF